MLRLLGLATYVIASLLAVHQASARCVGMKLSDGETSAQNKTTCASTRAKVPGGGGKTFSIGPGQQYTEIGDVPWPEITAGDTVYIHHRTEPYREKILISGRGTPSQWIRIHGVPSAGGKLPVISGREAVTSANMRYRWPEPNLVEWLGVVQIAVAADRPGNPHPLPPAYIEIANLQVQDGNRDNRFRSSNGTWLNYSGFAACIYARSVDHLVVRNSIMTNCGQGFYNWTGDGSSKAWWSAVQINTVLSGNHIFNNGNPGSYYEHQIYTESDGVTLEYNRLGDMRDGALGSQIKDRSGGMVIRYNSLVQAKSGWTLDLVEPEGSWPTIGKTEKFKQSFVYGNLIVSRDVAHPNIVHWNEDHQAGRGRATFPDARLHFYHNTVVIYAARRNRKPFFLFNGTWGGYECPPSRIPGRIDMRNNIVAVLPERSGQRVPPLRLGYCRQENIALSANWIAADYFLDRNVSGLTNVISPKDNDPKFISPDDFRLKKDSKARSAGKALANEISKNSLGLDLTPTLRFIESNLLSPRITHGPGSDLGAY